MPFIADTEQGGFIPDTQQGGFIPDEEEETTFERIKKFPARIGGALATGAMGLGEAVVAAPAHLHRQYMLASGAAMERVAKTVGASPEYLQGLKQTMQKQSDLIGNVLERPGELHRIGQEVITRRHPEWERDPPENVVDLLKSPDKLLYSLAESTPLLVSAGILTAAGAPQLSVGIMYASEGQEAYRQAKIDKATDAQAEKSYVMYGTVAAVIEQLQLQHILKIAPGAYNAVLARTAQKVAKGGTKSLTRQFITTAALEAAEEMAQGQWQDITAKVMYDKSMGDIASILDRRAQEGVIGATMGLIPGAGGAAAGKIAQRLMQKKEKVSAISEQIKEAEPSREVETGEPGFVRMPGEAEPAVKKRPSPSKEQLAVGHDLAKSLGMKTKERRTFMEEHTGVASMKNMTPDQASTYIDALHERAEKKKVDLDPFYKEHKFKKPGVLSLVTPQIYETRIVGMHFILKPAILGKQRLDIEASKIIRDVDKMQKVINRLGGETMASKAAAKLKNRPTKSIARMAELLNTYEDAPAELSRDEKQVFDFFRTLNRSIFERENQVRASLNMPQIEYKRGYLRHIADWQAQEVLEGRHSISPDLKYIVDKYSTSRKVYNPMEKQRQLGDELGEFFSKDLIAATKSMVVTGLKEIHLDQPLEYIKNQLDFYKEDIPASTRRWTDEFVRTMIRGEQTYTDQKLDDLVRDTGLGGLINKILRPFGRKVGHRPVTGIFQKAGRMQIYGVMGWRPKQLLRNKFQILQNLALYTIKSNLKSYRPADQQLQDLMSGSLFLKSYAGFDELSSIDAGIIGKMWLAPFQWTAVTNAKRAMKAAYYDTLELIEDPKYQEYGWADSQRTYDEKPGFLYESEKAKVLEEMEFGAGVTQYHYIPMAMPQVFRSKAGIPFTRLQSWWMNHLFKFHAEALHRGLYGKTRTGNKLPWSRRVGWLRYMIIGGSILSYLGYKSSFIWGAIPRNIPPMGAFLVWFWTYAFARDKKTRAYAKWKWMDALKTLIPGHLAIKDIKDVDSGKKPPESLFVYEEGVFAEEENVRKGI